MNKILVLGILISLSSIIYSNDINKALIDAVMDGNLKAVKSLIKKGADANTIDSTSESTILHIASYKGYTEIAKLLIDNGANVNAEAYGYTTPLMTASQMGHLEIALLLIKNKADINATDEYNRSSLVFAYENEHLEVVKLLIDSYATNPKAYGYTTPLHIVVFSGSSSYVKLAKYLIDNGADINSKTSKGYEPIHFAAMGGSPSLIKFLIDNGADVNAKTNEGKTPLDLASEWGYIEASNFLSNISATSVK